MEENLKSKINNLYSIISAYNNKILEKSNNHIIELKTIFEDSILFYISSHALSYLKNLWFNNLQSSGMFLNSRCIIEGYALFKMNKNKPFTKDQIELFVKQFNLIEFKNYNQIKNIYNKVLSYEKLQKDFNDSLKIYKEKLNVTNKKLKGIRKAQLPFLGKERTSFEQLVRENTEFIKHYKLFSQMIHPHDHGNAKVNNVYLMQDDMLNVLEELFGNISAQPSRTLEKDLTDFHKNDIMEHPLSILFNNQIMVIEGVINAFIEQDGISYVSNMFTDIRLLLEELKTDITLGYSEQIKMKFKVFLEMFACFDLIYFKKKEHLYKMLNFHSEHKLRINAEEDNDEYLLKAYEYFKNNYKTNLNLDTFTKTFNKTLGFLITYDNKIPTINDLVFDFIDKTTSDLPAVEGMDVGDTIKLLYKESQMLSHANGYLYFSNYGAWADDVPPIVFIDIAINNFLNLTLMWFEFGEKVLDEYQYVNFTAKLRPLIKLYDETMKIKHEFFKIKKIPKEQYYNEFTKKEPK